MYWADGLLRRLLVVVQVSTPLLECAHHSSPAHPVVHIPYCTRAHRRHTYPHILIHDRSRVAGYLPPSTKATNSGDAGWGRAKEKKKRKKKKEKSHAVCSKSERGHLYLSSPCMHAYVHTYLSLAFILVTICRVVWCVRGVVPFVTQSMVTYYCSLEQDLVSAIISSSLSDTKY